ncbi:THO complex subunit 5B-like isoform X5 [Andrographis paniculata]|uniref:THO complex subunit 5B-like isoform X5 n=1 Tax=Andrographis paniculata TaxID=175694 RepID=UPI0021E8AC47|nr:THO complex subunit 5B-like isoform X5 [Andrographis paniculata]
MEVTMAEAVDIQPECNVDVAALEDNLRQTKAAVEELVEKMLTVKKEAQPKLVLRELVTQVLLNFVTLTQTNRTILLEEDRVKAETERAKFYTESATQNLHNLMYEKNQYFKGINASKDFKCKLVDIELVSEEEYLRDATEEVKSSALSADGIHDLMLKRLNYELSQRKELRKLRSDLEQRKKALQETIANRKKFMSSLPSLLKALKKASSPMENQLGFMHGMQLKQEPLAELLPTPLYVLYSKLLVQKEVFGENIELEIKGSVKDAQAFIRPLVNKDSAVTTNIKSSKMETDIPNEEDDGHSGVYQSHPLKVSLHVYNDELFDLNSARLITLDFEYLIKLNVVCVEAEDSEVLQNDMLCNLFPDDPGLELPQQSAKLRFGDSLSFDENRRSRPYRWAQHLAGIEFLPEVSPLVLLTGGSDSETTKHGPILSGLSLYRHQNRVQTLVQRLRARKKAQLSVAFIGGIRSAT